MYNNNQNQPTLLQQISTRLQSAATESIAFLKTHSQKNRHPFFQKVIRGYVISSDETRDWAWRIQRHFHQEFTSLYQGTNLKLETIFVKGCPGEIISALIKNPRLKAMDKEGASFVITPGYSEAMLFNEVRNSLSLSVKQLYCVQGALTTPFNELRSNIAGVHNKPMKPQEYVDGLKAVIPHLRKICIAYTPSMEHPEERKMLEAQREAIINAFTQHHIAVTTHLWDEQNPYVADLAIKLTEVDALITLDELAMHNHRTQVIELCNHYKKPLCASELDSVFAGAALGCGITRDAFVKPMLSVLHNMMFPMRSYTPSIEIPMQIGLRYNPQALEAQGIIVTPEMGALMRMKSIFDTDIIRLCK